MTFEHIYGAVVQVLYVTGLLVLLNTTINTGRYIKDCGGMFVPPASSFCQLLPRTVPLHIPLKGALVPNP